MKTKEQKIGKQRGERLTSAAERMGCSVRTVEKRIAAGWLYMWHQPVPGGVKVWRMVDPHEVDLLIRGDLDELRQYKADTGRPLPPEPGQTA